MIFESQISVLISTGEFSCDLGDIWDLNLSSDSIGPSESKLASSTFNSALELINGASRLPSETVRASTGTSGRTSVDVALRDRLPFALVGELINNSLA